MGDGWAMARVSRATRGGERAARGWTAAFVGLAGLLAAGLWLAPGDLAGKAHLALQGLCAQRPAHTFALGGVPLPFDARMTGLYLGVLVAGLPLAPAGGRGAGLSLPWLATLAGFVAAMGLDGFNSLRVDLGWAAWWPPDNRLRLVTGLLAGLSLGVALAWLLALALAPADRPLLRRRDALIWLAAGGAALTTVLSGAGWAWLPLTLLLLAGALMALLLLNLALLLLVGERAPAGATLPRLATLALAGAVFEMGLLATGRGILEGALGRGWGG
jgi:uncharacterized membrane protein